MVVGARLAANGSLSLADIRVRLERQHARLDELSTGDIDVRASILTSVESLSDRARALFQRLALTPTPEWAGWVAESLSGLDSWGRDLDELVDRHLVEPVGRDVAGQPRFRMHGLVAVVAVELQSQAPHGLDDESGERLLSEWLSRAAAGRGAALRAGRRPRATTATCDSQPRARRDGHANTVRPGDWFEVERDNLVATCVGHHPRGACRCGDARARWRSRPLRSCALAPTTTTASGSCATPWRRCPRPRQSSKDPCWQRCSPCRRSAGSTPSCLPSLRVSCDLARRTGDRPREFTALMQSGWAAQTAASRRRCGGLLRGSRPACARAGRPARSRARPGLPPESRCATRDAQASADPLLARTVDDVRAAGQARDTCIWLVTRAEGLIDLGAVDEADELLDEASDIAEQLGDELGLAHCRMARAGVLVVRRDPGAADDVLALSRPVLDTQAPGGCEPEALRVAADVAVLRQDHAHACEALAQGEQIWRARGDSLELARDLARLSLLDDGPRRRGPRGAADPRRPRSRPEGPAPAARTLRGPLNCLGETGRASPLTALGAGYLHLGWVTGAQHTEGEQPHEVHHSGRRGDHHSSSHLRRRDERARRSDRLVLRQAARGERHLPAAEADGHRGPQHRRCGPR